MKVLPNAAYLSECLDLDENTGVLIWKDRPKHHFSSAGVWKRWNMLYAGHRAFCAVAARGYRVGCLNSQTFLAHRIIWAMRVGEVAGEIDHINGDRLDNSIKNLRLVDHQTNSKNCKVRCSSPSKTHGVSYHKSKKAWEANIWINGKRTYIGRFKDIDKAIEARTAAQNLDQSFHKNHGRI